MSSPKPSRLTKAATAELFSTRRPTSLAGRVLQFPLVRMLVCALFLLVFLFPHNTVIADVLASSSGKLHTLLSVLDGVTSIAVLLFLYRLYVRWVEGRPAVEVGVRGALPEFAAGFAISLAIAGFMVLVMALTGVYRIESFSSFQVILDAVVRFGVGAFAQVLAFRLMLFRFSEELLGTWIALAVVAAVFGLAHMWNDNASAWSTAALILGDVLLAAAFIYTHRLWMVWGVHAGWNFVQDGIFGMPNSGLTQFPSWITPAVHGPTWLTGGNFGIEASPLQLLLSVGVGLFLLQRAHAAGQIVGPAWRRQRPQRSST